MAGPPATTGRCIPAWPKDALRISFGVIWLIDAILKWLPGFRSGYMGMIMGQAQGQPAVLKPWFDWACTPGHSRSPPARPAPTGTCARSPGTPRKA